MKTKRNIALAGFALALGAVLVINVGAGGGGHEPFKLEGCWLAHIPGLPNSWTYAFAPSDPNGREAVFTGTVTVSDPTLGGVFPTAEYETTFIGQAVVTGPNEAAYTVMHYGMKKGNPFSERVWINMDSGVIKRTGPGQVEVSHNLSYYLAAQDADGDGLPDKGQTPIACVPVKSFDTRLPLLPPCKP